MLLSYNNFFVNTQKVLMFLLEINLKNNMSHELNLKII